MPGLDLAHAPGGGAGRRARPRGARTARPGVDLIGPHATPPARPGAVAGPGSPSGRGSSAPRAGPSPAAPARGGRGERGASGRLGAGGNWSFAVASHGNGPPMLQQRPWHQRASRSSTATLTMGRSGGRIQAASWDVVCLADLPIPPPLIQVADLPAVDRRVEDRGDDLELLGAVVLVAGIHGHLPHQSGSPGSGDTPPPSSRAACWAAARG